MKPVLLFITLYFSLPTGAQLHPYPLQGIGVEPGMKILGKWGDPVNLPDGKMAEKEYVYADLSPRLKKSEIKEYGKSPLPRFILQYEGELKNKTFHGYGKLDFRNTNTGYLDWSYTGEFENGKANGFGELRCTYNYKVYRSDSECWFRGEFKDGQPVEGSLFMNFQREKTNTPTVFYSGQVLFEQGKIRWHGFGALLRTEMDHSNPKMTSNLGIGGAFYLGQFYKGSATGYAITNTVDSTGRLGSLSAVLSGADDIFFQYEDLKFYADFLAGTPYTPPTGKTTLYRMLPQMDKSVYKDLPLSKEIIYKGMVLDNQPYGLGYVEYSGQRGNYRDLGFWKNGQKVSVEQVLKNLLPDSNWLQKKQLQVYVQACTSTWNEKLKKLEETCNDNFRKAVYYGPLSSQGHPIGWGWIHNDETGANSFNPLLGEFTGADLSTDKSTMLGAERLYSYTYNQQWQYNYYNPQLAAQDQYYSIFEPGVFDQRFPVHKTVGFKRYFTRTAFAEDRFIEERHVDYVKFEREFKQQLATRPVFYINSFYRRKSNMQASYIQNEQGQQLQGIYIPRDEIGRGDYVFLGSAFYYVHDSYRNIMLGITPTDGFWLAAQIPATVFVIRGYNLKGIEHQLIYCSGCSDLPPLPTGPVTITGSAHSGRYETNVYQNNSGGGSVVSKAIYNQISITLPPPTRKPCKVCNDRRKSEKVPVRIVEI